LSVLTLIVLILYHLFLIHSFIIYLTKLQYLSQLWQQNKIIFIIIYWSDGQNMFFRKHIFEHAIIMKYLFLIRQLTLTQIPFMIMNLQ